MSIIRTVEVQRICTNRCTGNTFLVEVLIPLAGNQEKPCRQSPIHSLQRVQNLNHFIFSQNQASLHTAPLLPLPPDFSSRFPASFLEGLGYFYWKQAVLSIMFQTTCSELWGSSEVTHNCCLFPEAKSWKDAFIPLIDTEFLLVLSSALPFPPHTWKKIN